LQLASIGTLTAREDLAEEGIKGATQALTGIHDLGAGAIVIQSLVEVLLPRGRNAEAEGIVANELAKGDQQAYILQPLLGILAVIYDRAGRYNDVMNLMDNAGQWGVMDVSGLAPREILNTPLLVVAARALLKTGKTAQARETIRRLIETKPGYDPGYALLLEMGGADVETFLDMLAKRDRFEERPLIWKAKLQLDAGRVEEAEKTARSAIAIDPSDGEEGKGDRMRAYAVLADILDKKGDSEQAKSMRGVVAAIRLSESADDWWRAGLLTRAVKMYEQALGYFADAYCIQSRLVLRYGELGDFAKAEQHYQRAFELMPDSFGRIESHCFGCEGSFSGERAQGIAERVFTRLAENVPEKPQIFYLLGYLRREQGRTVEAAEDFRKAAKLDPDYFNA
jgi:tetratricopeptide (TPR) repeat protein